MGKAMMGTGEASGERRAIQAAEAAIANPLLDETSMKGARGLLISITGGKDLTLFEVDEAATRIREEVDPDANIILGATFEESLEGVIRCSVVATGIDSEAREDSTPAEHRMAELSQRLRTATAPAAKAAPAPAPAPAQATRPAAAAPIVVRSAPAPQPKPVPVAQTPSPDYGADIEAITASLAQPVQADPGISITPIAAVQPNYPHDDLDGDLGHASDPVAHEPAEEHYIPPAPEAPSRMPKVEDFPPVAQRQMEARQQKPVEEDRGPLGLLRRLAGVGLGRREEDPIGAGPKAPARQPQVQPQLRPQPRVQAPPPPPQQSEYAKRPPQPRAAIPDAAYKPRPGELDQHGRALPRDQRSADDELEIPAFLRRQAN
jgi:cell division protein FtsZ